MFRKQFLLCKQECLSIDGMLCVDIGGYKLNYNSENEYTYSETNGLEIHLLGSLFSCDNPELTNQELLDSLSSCTSLKQFLIDISEFYGAYVLIYKDNNNLIIFNDACAQAEVYYSDDFTTFGSQLKLLSKVIDLVPHVNSEANAFYNSKEFESDNIFINNTTPAQNVKHLMSNHYVDVLNKECIRFFPIVKKETLPLQTVAIKAANMIKGYIKAISLRHDICLPITAGYDSRVLFLASKDLKCDYFITKLPKMNANHVDIIIGKKLAGIYGKDFEIIEHIEVEKNQFDKNYIESLDYPRYSGADLIGDRVIINGNISEIARNGFDYHSNLTAKDMCFLNHKKINNFIIDEYNEWLTKNANSFKSNNYNLLDLFLWEDYMGILHSKTKIEASTLGVTVMTPYNSRKLLNLMLSVKRSDRDKFSNVLYDKMINYLSDDNEEVKNTPINPGKARDKYLRLQKYGVYKLFLFVKIKTKTSYLYRKLKED